MSRTRVKSGVKAKGATADDGTTRRIAPVPPDFVCANNDRVDEALKVFTRPLAQRGGAFVYSDIGCALANVSA